MRRGTKLALALGAAFALGGLAALARPWVYELWLRSQVLDSGGPLTRERAAYDVRRYEVAIALEPERRRIGAESVATIAALAPLDELVLDLDGRLEVTAVEVDGAPASSRHRRDEIRVALEPAWAAGERHRVRVAYGGKPKVAALPPWYDGFVWERTPSGAPWIAVVTQGDGADDWLPVKDHPSDRPEEGVEIALTVPAGLVGVANGRRLDERANADGTVTSRWRVSYPINNYLLTVAAAPYVELVERYRGVDGTLDVPMTLWVLPEHAEAARALWREAPRILEVYARRFGEFPFLADKIGAVEAPFDGMEHQTLVALGPDFSLAASGLYETLVHELAHEWWGNHLAARDWDDFWIHEGFATWAESLYVEETMGTEAGRAWLETLRPEIENRAPLVAGRPRTSAEAYGHDLYVKGAWVVASLRWQLGDETFFRALRELLGEPGAGRLIDSAELERTVAEVCACELGSFWDRYLRAAAPPQYRLERATVEGGEEIRLAWDDPGLELALPVEIDGALRRVEMPAGAARFTVPAGAVVRVATAGRLLAEAAER